MLEFYAIHPFIHSFIYIYIFVYYRGVHPPKPIKLTFSLPSTLPLLSPHILSPPFPSPSLHSLPLEVGPVKSSYEVRGAL